MFGFDGGDMRDRRMPMARGMRKPEPVDWGTMNNVDMSGMQEGMSPDFSNLPTPGQGIDRFGAPPPPPKVDMMGGDMMGGDMLGKEVDMGGGSPMGGQMGDSIARAIRRPPVSPGGIAGSMRRLPPRFSGGGYTGMGGEGVNRLGARGVTRRF